MLAFIKHPKQYFLYHVTLCVLNVRKSRGLPFLSFKLNFNITLLLYPHVLRVGKF